MNSSQLRMAISNLKESTKRKELVISQVSTVVLSYLTLKEQIWQG